MSLAGLLESLVARTRHVLQENFAAEALRRAKVKEAESDASLETFDRDMKVLEETLTRLRDRGALYE